MFIPIVMIITILLIPLFIILLNKRSQHKTDNSSMFINRRDQHAGLDQRILYGMPLRTREDEQHWWVLKGKGDGYVARLFDLEKRIESETETDPDSCFAEWKERYQKYRDLCVSTHMWNELIGDHAPFLPTQQQRLEEERLLQKIQTKLKDSNKKRELYKEQEKERLILQKEILDYLLKQPYHKSLRHLLIRNLSEGDEVRKKAVSAEYRRMIRQRILIEKQGEDGKYTVKKAPANRTKDTTHEFSLPASYFRPDFYKLVDRVDEYKVLETVAKPINVDREKNIGEFISVTRGDHYWTSLEACTCPAYESNGSRPCKHMIALAKYLGYRDCKTNW